MHLRKYLLYFSLLLSVNLLVSCDDDDDEDTTPNKTDMLVSGEWRGDQIRLNGTNPANIPGIGNNANAFQTLVLDFEEDNTYTANFTAGGQPQSFDGTWELNSDQSKITLDTFGELDVETLTEEDLEVTTTLETDRKSVV